MNTANTRPHRSSTSSRRPKSAAHGGPSPARESGRGAMAGQRQLDESGPGRQLTIEEVAERLNTTVRLVRGLIEQRRITYIKLGEGKRSPVRIPERVLNDFIVQHTIEADG